MSHDAPHHGPRYYIKIWAILLVLLIISLIGPELGIRSVTLITAFGIAFVKAYLVASYFMHLNIEKRYILYMLAAMLIAAGMFFMGTATDIMKPTGERWENKAALELIKTHGSGANGQHNNPH